MGVKVAASLLAADWLRLGEEVESAQEGGTDLLHCDIMDGHFVPNLTMGPQVVAAVARRARVPLDVHLMLDNPGDYIVPFAEAGASIIGFHLEATGDPGQLIRRIHECGVRCSLTLNPDTPAEAAEPFLGQVEQVLVMSVYPGFGGQKFMPEVLGKVRRIREAAPDGLDIEIDGGINRQTARQAVAAGANILVAGTAVFGAPDRRKAIAELRG